MKALVRFASRAAKASTIRHRLTVSLVLITISIDCAANLAGQTSSNYPHNGTSCEQCHALPTKFGSSPLTVFRIGSTLGDRFAPGPEGGILHRQGPYSEASDSVNHTIIGERVTISLLGDGYIEAIDQKDIEQNARQQQESHCGIVGMLVRAPALEAPPSPVATSVGRFGWKSQHSSLLSAVADSLRNELGIRNRLYPDEYSNHRTEDGPTPIESAYSQPGQVRMEEVVEEVRNSTPPGRDSVLFARPAAQSGEKLFSQIGCALCHVSTYKTMPVGTPINGGTYKIPASVGDTVIHPYSDFLVHDVGTGDGIPEAARPELLDPSTANRFRTPPLWGVRARAWLMHDGKSSTVNQAIERHHGEAESVRERYTKLSAAEKRELDEFLNSL
jgi:CxxC motif-containing protein (DUF1111 family)